MPPEDELYLLDQGKDPNMGFSTNQNQPWMQSGFTPLVTPAYNAPNGFATSWAAYQNQVANNPAGNNGVLPPAGAGTATAGGSLNPAKAVLGGIQIIGGLVQARKLAKEAIPQYGATADLQGAKARAGERARRGFTTQQVGAFQQDLARTLNTDFQNSVNQSGGNLATALSARNMGARLRTLNSFAAANATQQAQNIAQDNALIAQMQSIKNMNDQYAIQRRQAQEQAAGQAIKTGTENLASSFDLGQAAKMLAGGL
jgi:hypothetical protein